jgi:16S rRNA G966 N2-methylase RsmD
MSHSRNRLCLGDNLDILRREIAPESADFIYLDPPFNSNASYNVLFKEKSGEESAAQITAFEDETTRGTGRGKAQASIKTS